MNERTNERTIGSRMKEVGIFIDLPLPFSDDLLCCMSIQTEDVLEIVELNRFIGQFDQLNVLHRHLIWTDEWNCRKTKERSSWTNWSIVESFHLFLWTMNRMSHVQTLVDTFGRIQHNVSKSERKQSMPTSETPCPNRRTNRWIFWSFPQILPFS